MSSKHTEKWSEKIQKKKVMEEVIRVSCCCFLNALLLLCHR